MAIGILMVENDVKAAGFFTRVGADGDCMEG